MKIKLLFLVILFVVTAAVFSTANSPISMAASGIPACDAGSNAAICKTNSNLLGGVLKNVINIMLYLAGIIAVIMVVIGGLRYITSDGDPQKANQAKNTILYALIGVTVAVLAFSIVNFVIAQL